MAGRPRRAPRPRVWPETGGGAVSTSPDPLPANVDAEKTILGAILLDNAAHAEAVELGLSPADFSLDSHRRIWKRMGALMKARRAVDIVTLSEELGRYKEIESIGGVCYLASLTEGLPRRLVIENYVHIVKEKTQARKLLSLTNEITTRIDAGNTPAEINAWALSTLEAIGKDSAHESSTWAGEGMESFLADAEGEIEWLIENVLCRACLTQLFAPRGIGKSILALHWGVTLARRGLRVLILDRDNTRRTVRQRLRGFGAENLSTLRIVSREKCPPLTQPEAWVSFPYDQFDVVIVDSLDAMAEGVGEQDSAKPAKALAPLLDIAHRENGPAVLVLGNTVKSAQHSRGSGVVEDRADIVFEARDATGFKPSGTKPWIEELPAQGAAEWAARSARRKGRSDFRVALVATKFRDGEEPAPRILEARLGDIPYIVEDVTTSVDAAGEAERDRVAKERRAKHEKGAELLSAEIQRRAEQGEPALLKRAAENFLRDAKYSNLEARDIVKDHRFTKTPGVGQGHPVEVGFSQNSYESSWGVPNKPNTQNSNKEGDSEDPLFGTPYEQRVSQIPPSEPRMDKGDSQSNISDTLSKHIGNSPSVRNIATPLIPIPNHSSVKAKTGTTGKTETVDSLAAAKTRAAEKLREPAEVRI